MHLEWLPPVLIALIFIILTPFVWKRLTGTLERVGWISGIIAALFTLLPISIRDIPLGWNFIPVIVAILILGITAYFSKLRKVKIQHNKVNLPVEVKPKRIRLSSTFESELDDLIQEIDFFIEKWRKSTTLKTCYRRDIEMRTMWQNRGKMREHSKEIRKKIKPLRRLQGSRLTETHIL